VAIILIVRYFTLLYFLPHDTLVLEVNWVMGITDSNSNTGGRIAYNFDQIDTIITKMLAL